MLYFDTSYLIRLYLDDPGSEPVRELAAQHDLASAWLGQAEILCSLHRSFREGRLDAKQHRAQRDQFRTDHDAGAYRWLPLTDPMLVRLDHVLNTAPISTFLRAADALHLACAAENGFTEVYSNDRDLLAAAPLFDLRGMNFISGPSLNRPNA